MRVFLRNYALKFLAAANKRIINNILFAFTLLELDEAISFIYSCRIAENSRNNLRPRFSFRGQDKCQFEDLRRLGEVHVHVHVLSSAVPVSLRFYKLTETEIRDNFLTS